MFFFFFYTIFQNLSKNNIQKYLVQSQKSHPKNYLWDTYLFKGKLLEVKYFSKVVMIFLIFFSTQYFDMHFEGTHRTKFWHKKRRTTDVNKLWSTYNNRQNITKWVPIFFHVASWKAPQGLHYPFFPRPLQNTPTSRVKNSFKLISKSTQQIQIKVKTYFSGEIISNYLLRHTLPSVKHEMIFASTFDFHHGILVIIYWWCWCWY